MPTRTARSTAAQRADLVRLTADLVIALDGLPKRFWLTRNQADAYETVMAHLRAWIAWEEDEND